ncbi:MAG: thioredoxin family protein [bacterium]|nr:thioredoxin family protein [bacterium]
MPTYSNKDNLGSAIINFSLKGTDEKFYSPENFDEKDILVIIFMCNHCPYVKAIAERLALLQDKFRSSRVQLIGINSNDPVSHTEDSFENMKLFSEKYGLNFPYLIDESQDVAKLYEAVCTPDIYVYDRQRKLRYRGRLDDNWKDESKVTQKELENAIQLLIDGKEIDFEQIPSMGCSIKWKNE